METPGTQKAAPKARSTRSECCTDLECKSGLRNNYYEGKRLTPHSFLLEQRYLVERRQLLNRAIHGWGVVYGYSVAPGSPNECRKEGVSGMLDIGPGLALDECGRELLQTSELPVALDDLIVLDGNGARTDPEREFGLAQQSRVKTPEGSRRPCWLLSVHYAEQRVEPVKVSDPCHCEHHEWDRTCETVRYTLRRIPCEECCRDFECELQCTCGASRCCDPSEPIQDAKTRPVVTAAHQRGGCRCLCEHLTGLQPGCDCVRLCEIEEPCAHVWVDLRHGVPLACVEVVRDECERWTLGTEVEACGPRRLVKRNDLLFDLIRGCDVTRIIEIGWKDWHRLDEAVSFEDFSSALGPEGERKDEYVTNGFWVKFSRPVRTETLLRPDCFAMTVMSVEREGGWWQTMRVPIVRVDTTLVPPEKGDPAHHARSARVVVDGAWLEDGVRGRRSLFLGGEARVEIEVRGDFIVDCNGQTVDANAVGLGPAPTGNGTPGGTFVSVFRVAAAREAPSRPVPHSTADRQGATS